MSRADGCVCGCFCRKASAEKSRTARTGRGSSQGLPLKAFADPGPAHRPIKKAPCSRGVRTRHHTCVGTPKSPAGGIEKSIPASGARLSVPPQSHAPMTQTASARNGGLVPQGSSPIRAVPFPFLRSAMFCNYSVIFFFPRRAQKTPVQAVTCLDFTLRNPFCLPQKSTKNGNLQRFFVLPIQSRSSSISRRSETTSAASSSRSPIPS